MFYSSDAKKSNHNKNLSPSFYDKYSSVRALDKQHNNIGHAVSETNIFSQFSNQVRTEQADRAMASRPYSTIELRREPSLTSRDERKTKSFSLNTHSKCVNNSRTIADPFADIVHSLRESLDLAIEPNVQSKGNQALMDTDLDFSTWKPEVDHPFTPVQLQVMSDFQPVQSDMILSGRESELEPAVSYPNWSAVNTEFIPLTNESRVSTPRYHALSEDELEEELREENEICSHNDSVVLRHEIIRSYSINEHHSGKSNKEKPVALDETDSRRGYVRLKFDTSGLVMEDDFQAGASPLSKTDNVFLEHNSSFPSDPQDPQLPPKCDNLSNATQNLDIDSKSSANYHNSLKNSPCSVSESQMLAHWQTNQNIPIGQDSMLKRLTVDVGELNRKPELTMTLKRHKNFSLSGGTVHENKFLYPRSSRVATLFSSKLPEARYPEKQKGKQPIDPGFVFFGDGLFDFTEERNEEAVAFSAVLGELRSSLCGQPDFNLGYLLSPVITQTSNSTAQVFDEVQLCLEIFIEGQGSPVVFECSSKTSVGEVVAKVLRTVWKQDVTQHDIINSAFTLKVCGFEEYLSGSKLLCEYRYVHQCIMARQHVRLALMDSDQVPRALARSEIDDIADCEPRFYSQFFDRPLDTSVSREGLTVLREAFEEELKRVLKDADSSTPRFQPGRLVQSVRAVCTTLGQIETKGIVNYVYSLKEMKRAYDETCQNSTSPITVDLIQLRNVLQNLYKHVYLLIELYCNTFNTDFGRIRISEKLINGSIEVTAMTDNFRVYIPAAYRIPPEWKEKFEGYIVEAKIYYGDRLLLAENTVTGEIRTNFFPQISWQCWVEFAIEIRKLQRESKLCLTLFGLSTVSKNATISTRTPLGWTAVQLFDFNGLLVSGSQLFGLWPNQAANSLGTCTSNLIDKRSAILQVDFTRHLSDIVFPALKIPDAGSNTPDFGSTEMFSKLLTKDIFEDLCPEEVSMIWKSRYIASQVSKYYL